MERRSGRDLGLSVRMGVALVLLAILYFPLPIAFVMVVLGLTGSWLLAVGALAAVSIPLCYLPALSERIALAAAHRDPARGRRGAGTAGARRAPGGDGRPSL